jgi:hypothetical protein
MIDPVFGAAWASRPTAGFYRQPELFREPGPGWRVQSMESAGGIGATAKSAGGGSALALTVPSCKSGNPRNPINYGAAKRIRTPDPRITNS